MAATLKTAREVRSEASRKARDYAKDRDATGDPEGAGEFRDLAQAIDRIHLRRTK